MKIFIIVYNYPYEGYSEPYKAFDTEEKAKAFCDKENEGIADSGHEYFELELE